MNDIQGSKKTVQQLLFLVVREVQNSSILQEKCGVSQLTKYLSGCFVERNKISLNQLWTHTMIE